MSHTPVNQDTAVAEPEANPIKVLHLVSATHQHANGAPVSPVSAQLAPLLARVDREHFEMQVINFAPGDRQAAVMRQLGIPVHDIELSRRRFAPGALGALRQQASRFQPDLIHAWGHTASLAIRWLKGMRSTPMLWTMPTGKPDNAHFIDRYKLKQLSKLATTAKHIVYPSRAMAAEYRRLGFPEQNGSVIAAGVDLDRFKPDARLGQQLRAQLKLEANAFVIGMHATFAPENDFASFVRATAELIKFNPNVYVVLAGKGVQRGNSGIMALLGGGTLATRTTLLGEWSDLSALFNACDVFCSSALNDGNAHMLASAMLCGVPCVGTGKGLQGEVLSQHGIAIEPGSPNGLVRGITRVLEMSAEKRVFMAEAARRHVIANFSMQGGVQKYLGLYLQMTHAVEAATAERALKLQRAIGR
ncbi:MAG: glycosyltransferase [Steroidobacteraceae bacterium]